MLVKRKKNKDNWQLFNCLSERVKNRERKSVCKVLFISVTGIAEPLGESQVLEYLEGLSKDNKIYLYSFERPKDKGKLPALEKRISSSNIEWHKQYYSNKFGIVSAAIMLLIALMRLLYLTVSCSPDIIHCRSFMPAILGYILAKMSRRKLLFDIRGFAMDEKVESRRLSKNSLVYQCLNRVENYLYKNADHIVVLTHASKKILLDITGRINDEISVIPTCANRALFYPPRKHEKEILRAEYGLSDDKIIFIHVGTVVSRYDFDSELLIFKELYKHKMAHYFVVLTRDDCSLIYKKFDSIQLPKQCLLVVQSELNHVRDWLIIADYAIFFTKPSFAKLASSPTKFAEMIACHLPVVTNTGDGDLENYMQQYSVGIMLNISDAVNSIQSAGTHVKYFLEKTATKLQDFDTLFNKFFSKEAAIIKYNTIYQQLFDLLEGLNESKNPR